MKIAFSMGVVSLMFLVVVQGFAPSFPRPSSGLIGLQTPVSTTETQRPIHQYRFQAVASSLDEIDQEALLEYLDSGLSISFAEYQTQKKLLGYLEGCPIFRQCSKPDLERIAKSMKLKTLKEGEVVIRQGEIGDNMFFLVKGELDCIDQVNNTVYTTYKTEGAYFGELSLLFEQKRAATIVATANSTVYSLNKAAFSQAMKDSSVWEPTRQQILQKYQKTRIRDVLALLSPEEWLNLIQAKLAPWLALVAMSPQRQDALRAFGLGAAATALLPLVRLPPNPFSWNPILGFLDSTMALPSLIPLRFASFCLFVSSWGKESSKSDAEDAKASADIQVNGEDATAPLADDTSIMASARKWLATALYVVSLTNLVHPQGTLSAWSIGGWWLVVSLWMRSIYQSTTAFWTSKKKSGIAVELGLPLLGLSMLTLPILQPQNFFNVYGAPVSRLFAPTCLLMQVLLAIGKFRWTKWAATVDSVRLLTVVLFATGSTSSAQLDYLRYIKFLVGKWNAFAIAGGCILWALRGPWERNEARSKVDDSSSD